MNVQINTIDEFDSLNAKLREMLADVNSLSTAVDTVKFLTIKKITELTGWNENTTRAVFNRPDFPSCDFGREKIVEIHALINYFSVPRRK